ncbi:MAG: Arm DNA-binding domain-containing protein, partial [Polaromonas sp.]
SQTTSEPACLLGMTGFLLSHAVSLANMTYRQRDSMSLTDTFAKSIKHTGATAGDKHIDGGGMYLLVNAGGKYWRMNCRFSLLPPRLLTVYTLLQDPSELPS